LISKFVDGSDPSINLDRFCQLCLAGYMPILVDTLCQSLFFAYFSQRISEK